MKKHNLFKVIVAFFCSLFFLLQVSGITPAASVEPFSEITGVSYAYVYNFESNKVVFTKGAGDAKIAPASTVKIMSGLVALEYLSERQEEYITLTNEMLNGVEGYTVNLCPGETLKIKDLLYGLICGGGNDAATAIAIISAGSVEDFVAKMNDKAASLGMNGTFYTNPTGIDDPNMKTTLNDTVTVSKEAIKNELFVKMSSANNHSYTLKNSGETRTVANRNGLISSYSAIGYQNKRVKGLNAGMTDAGGYCVSAYATNGQDSYLCIVMGGIETASGKIMSYTTTNQLLSYYFDNYTYTMIAEKNDTVGEIVVELALPTNGSQAVVVDCIIEDDIYAFAPSGIDYKKELTYKTYYFSETLTAPVYKNDIVGGVDIYYNDEYLASARLLSNDHIEESELLVALDKMKSFILSRWILIFVLIAVPSVLLYFYLTVWKTNNKKKTSNSFRQIKK